MTVKSVFEMKFPKGNESEGHRVSTAIGNDMPPLDGYLGHEVIVDVNDRGHMMVITHWQSPEKAWAVLGTYKDDAKVAQATKLMDGPPSGFVGEVQVTAR